MSILPIVPIMPLGAMSPIAPTSLNSTPNVASGTDFSKFLSDALGQVDALQKNADAASMQVATGQVQDMSTMMVAIEKATLSMSLAVSTRDKVLDAYNQVMRMQM